MKLPDKVYNILKWIALICLPALSTFYGIIADIWNLPYGEQIPRTLTAIGLLIGALIGISQMSYNKENNIDASV